MKNPGIWFNFCESIVTHDFRLAVWDVLPIPGEFHLEMISWHLGSPAPNGWWNNTGAAKWEVANNVSIFSKSKIFTLVYDVETKRSSSSTERYGATLFEPQMF